MPFRLNIQTKLVGTLVLAGLVPLLVALVVLLVSVYRIRIESIGQSFQAAAHMEAEQVSTVLSDQVELAYLLSRLPGTAEFLERANRANSPTTSYALELDQRWAEMAPNEPPLRQILNNPLATRWRSIRQERVRFAEVLVTDVHGRLVAATNKPSDYYQADEDWWQRAYNNGRGAFVLLNTEWDESAVGIDGSPAALVMNLAAPIHGAAPSPDGTDLADPADGDGDGDGDDELGPVIGVMKVSLDAAWLVAQLSATASPGSVDARVQLVHASGVPVRDRPHGGAPLTAPPTATATALPPAVTALLRSRQTGWATQKDFGDEVYGFAAVEVAPGRLRLASDLDWYVVISASRAQVLAPLRRLTWLMLAGGIAGILLCFLGGVYIARREIIAPLRALRTGVAELGTGNINFRLPVDHTIPIAPEGAPFRHDEIGALAADFNKMADRLRDNVQRLEHADLLKRQFIDVASHELRTPITYILGVSQLAERQEGHSPLLAKIATKARRLARIIDNMFKLQGGSYASTLHLGPVDLRMIVDAVRAELQPFLQERRQQWDLRVDPAVPVFRGDAEKIRDVIHNLLSNAVRFSPDNTKISLIAAPRETSRGTGVEVTVIDSGPGIAVEELPHLFEPFAAPSAGADTTMHHTSGEFGHNTRGIGLGLSVVKRFVDLHGGTVNVETSTGGTKMRVWLPTPPIQDARAQDAAGNRADTTSAGTPGRSSEAPSYTI